MARAHQSPCTSRRRPTDDLSTTRGRRPADGLWRLFGDGWMTTVHVFKCSFVRELRQSGPSSDPPGAGSLTPHRVLRSRPTFAGPSKSLKRSTRSLEDWSLEYSYSHRRDTGRGPWPLPSCRLAALLVACVLCAGRLRRTWFCWWMGCDVRVGRARPCPSVPVRALPPCPPN